MFCFLYSSGRFSSTLFVSFSFVEDWRSLEKFCVTSKKVVLGKVRVCVVWGFTVSWMRLVVAGHVVRDRLYSLFYSLLFSISLKKWMHSCAFLKNITILINSIKLSLRLKFLQKSPKSFEKQTIFIKLNQNKHWTRFMYRWT